MPHPDIFAHYQHLSRRLMYWYGVLDTTPSSARADRASLQISALGDLLDDLEAQYPILRAL